MIIQNSRQQEILQQAATLLNNKGIKGLTTKALAQSLGLSEAALYRHFPNKESIIVCMLMVLKSNIENRLGQVLKNTQNQDSRTQLLAVFDSQFHYFTENPHYLVAILSEGLYDESADIHKVMLSIMQLKQGLLLQIIKTGQINAQITTIVSSEVITHHLMGSFRLCLLKWKLNNFSFSLIQSGNKIMDGLSKLLIENEN